MDIVNLLEERGFKVAVERQGTGTTAAAAGEEESRHHHQKGSGNETCGGIYGSSSSSLPSLASTPPAAAVAADTADIFDVSASDTGYSVQEGLEHGEVGAYLHFMPEAVGLFYVYANRKAVTEDTKKIPDRQHV